LAAPFVPRIRDRIGAIGCIFYGGLIIVAIAMPSDQSRLIRRVSTSATLPGPLARTLDAAEKPRVIFEQIVEPVILGREADQQSGGFLFWISDRGTCCTLDLRTA